METVLKYYIDMDKDNGQSAKVYAVIVGDRKWYCGSFSVLFGVVTLWRCRSVWSAAVWGEGVGVVHGVLGGGGVYSSQTHLSALSADPHPRLTQSQPVYTPLPFSPILNPLLRLLCTVGHSSDNSLHCPPARLD